MFHGLRDWLNSNGNALAVATTLTGFVIFAVRWFILHEVVGPIKHALTANGGKNNPPTIPDRFCELQERLDQQDEHMLSEHREAAQERAAFREWREAHSIWSDMKVDSAERRIAVAEARLAQVEALLEATNIEVVVTAKKEPGDKS